MDKLLYFYKKPFGAVTSKYMCVNAEFEKEIRDILKDYISNRDIELEVVDHEHLHIERPFYRYVDLYEVLTVLKDNGYKFTEEVESKYAYFRKKHDERVKEQQEREKAREAIKRKREEENKSVPTYRTYYWCWKLDFETDLATCHKCHMSKRFDCKPIEKRVKVK